MGGAFGVRDTPDFALQEQPWRDSIRKGYERHILYSAMEPSYRCNLAASQSVRSGFHDSPKFS